jgi:hypothetical protein
MTAKSKITSDVLNSICLNHYGSRSQEKHTVTVLDCSAKILFTMGLYYLQVFQQPQVSSVNRTVSTSTRFLSQQLFHSSFTISRFTGDASNRTVSSRLQDTTQDRTLQQSISLLRKITKDLSHYNRSPAVI